MPSTLPPISPTLPLWKCGQYLGGLRKQYSGENNINYLQTTLEVLAALHEVFDVVDLGEVDVEGLKELGLALGQVHVGQQAEESVWRRNRRRRLHGGVSSVAGSPEEVAEVVSRVEGEPLDVIQQHRAGHQQHLREVHRLDPLPLVSAPR